MPRYQHKRPVNELGQFVQECPEANDEAWLRNAYHVEGKTQRQIAEELNVTVGWIKVKFREFGIPGRPHGERNFSYTLTPEQRVARGWSPEPLPKPKTYPKAYDTMGVRTKEARLVASKMIGRKLRSKEVVHHIDENPFNNAPENLMVLASRAEHSRLHWALWKDRASRL